MNLTTSWKEYFKTLETNDDSNKNIDIFNKATSLTDDSTEDTIIKALTEDIDVTILTVAPVTGKIKVLHSPKNLGGTRIKPGNKIVALDGFVGTSTPVLLDNACVTSKVELRTPALSRMRDFDTIEDIQSSSPPTTGPLNFKHMSFIILPPFITEHILEIDTREPAELLLNCKNFIAAYDLSNNNNPDFKKAIDNCKNLITFLWAASKSLLPQMIFVTGYDDAEVLRWSSNRHNNCLDTSSSVSSGTPNVNNEIIQSLAHSIDTQTILFENMRQEKAEEKEEKQNKYSDLHDSTKLLILNASSQDGESTPEQPVQSCIDFFNKKNISKALDFLTMSLSQELNCCVNIETGLVTALYSGHFIRDRDDSPSNFSFFMTPKKQPLSSDRFKPTMILQLKASQGKGWSETDLKDALKQGIETPNDIHCFGHQLKNFWGLSSFFFGENSVLSQALEPLLGTISNHTLTFEAAQLRDKNFATKLGYAIDTRVFRWLQQCRTKHSRTQVNDSLLQFDQLIDQVLTDSFLQVLPTTFKNFQNSTKKTDDSDDDNSTGPVSPNTKKRRRNNTQSQKKNIEQNTKTITSWLAEDNDVYKRCFAAQNLKDRPMFKNKPMCQRYHSKGFCFDDCLNKITHVPSGDIDSATATAYKKYVTKCKAQK